MIYSVYVLQSLKNGRYYVGSTNDIVQRIKMHNDGRVLSTKAHRPWKLRYTETFPTKSEASKREFQIKSWKKRAAIEKLLTASSSSG
jgi:putative endonuclease